MKITICIPTCNRPENLKNAIESIMEGAIKPQEIVISDDSRPEVALQTKKIAEKYGVKYVEGPRKGLTLNQKNLLLHASGDFIVFLDDDMRIPENYIEEMIRCYSEYSKKYGEKIIITGREIRNGEEVTPGELTFLGYQARPFRNPENVKAIVKGSTLFPRKFLEKVYFDGVLSYGFDEVDLTQQALLMGYRIIFCPSVVNIHQHASAGREKYGYLVEKNRIYEMLKIYGVYQRNILHFLLYLIAGPLHLLLYAMKTMQFSLIRAIPSAFINFYHFYRRWKWR